MRVRIAGLLAVLLAFAGIGVAPAASASTGVGPWRDLHNCPQMYSDRWHNYQRLPGGDRVTQGGIQQDWAVYAMQNRVTRIWDLKHGPYRECRWRVIH